MNLREAAARTLLSITTLRRYIRSGRLHAEKSPGRYGPEYFLTERDLLDAGLVLERSPSTDEQDAGAGEGVALVERASLAPQTIHLHLYQELQMKHEQLLVQYGMVRASGLRVMELQQDLESSRAEVEELAGEIDRLRERLTTETRRFHKDRQEHELEMKGKSLEIDALQEKVRGLEMLMRNSVTTETIDQQVSALMDHAQRVGRRLPRSRPAEGPAWVRPDRGKVGGEH